MIKKILNALEADESPKLEFETDEARSYFITRLFIHEVFLDGSNDEQKRGRKKQAILDISAEILDLLRHSSRKH